MSTLQRFFPLALVFILGACATSRTPLSTPASTTAAVPAAVAGYDWFYNDGADEARLVYGVEASDDVRLALSCQPGRPALTLTAETHSGARAIHLESGGDTERFPARAEPSPLAGGDFLTAQGRSDAPVFHRFRRLGWLAIWDGEDRTVMAAHPGSSSRIEQFFTRCG